MTFLIMNACILILFSLCLFVQCNSYVQDGSVYDLYPNLQDNPMLCGRESWKKIYVCDPKKILGLKDVEASQLDEIIKKIVNETKCPCTNYVCSKDPEGYRVGVAIVNKLSDDAFNSFDDEDQYEQSLNRRKKNQRKLEDAARFAHQIRNSWKLGRCDEDVIIVYSHADKVIYTVTGDMASKVLTNKLITDITERVLPHGFHKGAFHGLNSILHDYRSVLLNIYQPRSSLTRSVVSSSATLTFTSALNIHHIFIMCLAIFILNLK